MSTVAMISPTSPSQSSPSCPIPPIPPDQIGLIAGISLLSGLLSFTLLTLTIVLVVGKRNGCRAKDQEPGQPLGDKTSHLEDTVSSLEARLRSKEAQLRDSQAALMEQSPHSSRRISAACMSDDQVRSRFEDLSHSIQSWAKAHFEGWSLTGHFDQNAMPESKRDRSNYEALLRSRETAGLVLKGLVGEIVCQDFEFLMGGSSYCRLRHSIALKAPAAEYHEWRTLTVRLLETSSEGRSERTDAIDSVHRKTIEMIMRMVTGSEPTSAIIEGLRHIIKAASALALDVGKQRDLFRFERPSGSIFNEATMEVAPDSDCGKRVEALRGKSVLAVTFPLVSRWSMASGYDQCVVVRKAQVLV